MLVRQTNNKDPDQVLDFTFLPRHWGKECSVLNFLTFTVNFIKLLSTKPYINIILFLAKIYSQF